jgi:nucleotide-binding universal stress UspA family protein
MSWLTDKKVVAPIDFSDDSKWGLDTALEIAGSAGSVHPIHVANAPTDLPPAISWNPGEDDDLREQLVNHFRQQYSTAPYRDLTLTVRFGDPGQQVTRFAEEIGADLIVLPSQGRTGLSHLLIGSVAERIARLANCPVLILRR